MSRVIIIGRKDKAKDFDAREVDPDPTDPTKVSAQTIKDAINKMISEGYVIFSVLSL